MSGTPHGADAGPLGEGDEHAYRVRARAAHMDDQRRVLMTGDTFALFDHHGDMRAHAGDGEAGLYHGGTRFLQRMELTLGGVRPLLLNSEVGADNIELVVDLTNPDLDDGGGWSLAYGTVHIRRVIVVDDGNCFEQVGITNFSARGVKLNVRFAFGADFRDIFEVRGTQRPRRGELLEPTVEGSRCLYRYIGVDSILRATEIETTPAPSYATPQRFHYDLELAPHDETRIELRVRCQGGVRVGVERRSSDVRAGLVKRFHEFRASATRIETANEQFNSWLARSYSDLCMMTVPSAYGPVPYAGVPWYATVFGRDSIITSLQCLWAMPQLARGVLAYLAAFQARTREPERDAEPGKIVHELRSGEMAALNEVPFGRYYGTIDATPLFVMLAAEYYQRTADRTFIDELWPAVERAIAWIDTYGDIDGDGFIEYAHPNGGGLLHQGWKDSPSAVFHADGSDAEHPIALCEVQAYAYGAYNGGAKLCHALGRLDQATALEQRAERLRVQFDDAFWLADLGVYALALDGRKRPCRVRTSNAGHCLWTGIARPERAHVLAQTLLSSELFSGWGVRTLAAGATRYNPIAYHNGSVWPHDNSIIAAGLARYGLRHEVHRLLAGMFDASIFTELNRLPELFCGFPRRAEQGPTRYPVACAPQAWACAAVFLFVQACLTLQVDASARTIVFDRPLLPTFLEEIRLFNLRLGEASIDLRAYRYAGDVGFQVLRKDGDAEIIVRK